MFDDSNALKKSGTTDDSNALKKLGTTDDYEDSGDGGSGGGGGGGDLYNVGDNLASECTECLNEIIIFGEDHTKNIKRESIVTKLYEEYRPSIIFFRENITTTTVTFEDQKSKKDKKGKFKKNRN